MSDSQDNKSLTLYLSLTSSPSAPRIPLTLPPTSNASTLRRLASAATNIPLDSLKLIFRGRVIGEKSEGDVGLEYKLEDESVIHVMGKPPVAAAGSGGGGAAAAAGTNIAGASVSMNSSTPATSNTSSPLASAMLTLRTNNNSETYRTALATADKLLSNIISHPMEEKYRSIKKSNPAFHKRLGGVSGGEALLLASGFVVESGGGVESYVLRPSADAWPRLVAAGEEIQRVLTEANATSASSPSATYDSNNNNNAATSGGGAGGMSNLFPGGIPSNAMGGSLGGPGMEAAMQSMLSNPQMLQNMMSNPMVQQMMRNDPRFANNPMLQQQIETLASNPQMIQQMSQLMSDPGMRANMSRMMQQQQQQQSGGGGGDPFAGGPDAMRRQMEQFQQLSQQFRGASGTFGSGNNATGTSTGQSGSGAAGTSNATGGNNASSSGGGGGGGGDDQMTEEEMIAEAIRRSMEES
ncbi:predicted protein [Thalassiosira pseudonana CCMP1335]|uniref:Ubiquitin-like domain-containing protein n=1 Tax=Thalassiosira pseudonana TaxID=35128 RepID=B8C198_THAPS|nr:predicted protein [Thalassiosira pseudonana CCMP1335]EED92740.1 predicted protein [Thalassiosira pseudonana CCMP1335]